MSGMSKVLWVVVPGVTAPLTLNAGVPVYTLLLTESKYTANTTLPVPVLLTKSTAPLNRTVSTIDELPMPRDFTVCTGMVSGTPGGNGPTYGSVSAAAALRKLKTWMSKMRRPEPHPAAITASAAPQISRARIRPSLIDRQRRRHRNPAFVRQRVRVRPEADVEAHRAEAHATAPAELDAFALIARDAAAQGDEAEPLLPADVHHAAPPGIQDIRAEGRVPDAVADIGDVGDRELGLRFHMVGDRLRERPVVVERAVLSSVGPRDRRPDVVHADPELDGPGDPREADVAPEPVTEGVPRLRVLGERPAIRRHRVRAAEDGVARDEPAIAVSARIADAEVVMQRAADVQSARAVPHDLARVADRRREPTFHDPVDQRAVPRVRLGGLRVAQKPEQRVAELQLYIIVEPAHGPDPKALHTEPDVQRPARATDPELVLRHQLGGLAEIDDEGVAPDGERNVVRRGRRLLHFQVHGKVENRVHDEDWIEPRRLRVERGIVREVRMVVEELDDPERNRDRELRLPSLRDPCGHRAIRGIIALEPALSSEAQARHAGPPRVGEGSLRGRRCGPSNDECR